MFVVIRLGQYAFPCGASLHNTHEEAVSAINKHAKEHGRKITGRSPHDNDGQIQFLTEGESYHSYLILRPGYRDDKDHGFAPR